MINKENILSILNDWNFWNAEPPASMPRPLYDEIKMINIFDWLLLENDKACGEL